MGSGKNTCEDTPGLKAHPFASGRTRATSMVPNPVEQVDLAVRGRYCNSRCLPSTCRSMVIHSSVCVERGCVLFFPEECTGDAAPGEPEVALAFTAGMTTTSKPSEWASTPYSEASVNEYHKNLIET